MKKYLVALGILCLLGFVLSCRNPLSSIHYSNPQGKVAKELSASAAKTISSTESEVTHTTEVLCFSGEFVRNTGKPIIERKTFIGLDGPATVRLENEGISSATVKVNGTQVFGPESFNQNVEELGATATLTKGSNNSIEVLLSSKPGSKVRVEVVQTVEGEGAAFIGKNGGIVEVKDPNSSLYNAQILVPEGAMPDDTPELITIESVPGLPIPIGSWCSLGVVFSINKESDEDFELPIEVKIPFDTTLSNAGRNVLVFYYAEALQELFPMPIKAIGINAITFFTIHTSASCIVYPHPNSIPSNKQVSFIPTKHGFYIDNFGFYHKVFPSTAEGGVCHGMCLYALYHHKFHSNETLFNKYREGVLDKWWYANTMFIDSYDDRTAMNIAFQSQVIGGHAFNSLEKASEGCDESGRQSIYQQIVGGLCAEQPMYLGLKNQNGSGHSVVVYRFDNTSDGITFFFYDPNRPSQEYDLGDLENECPKITWNNGWEKYKDPNASENDEWTPDSCISLAWFNLSKIQNQLDDIYDESEGCPLNTENFPIIQDLALLDVIMDNSWESADNLGNTTLTVNKPPSQLKGKIHDAEKYKLPSSGTSVSFIVMQIDEQAPTSCIPVYYSNSVSINLFNQFIFKDLQIQLNANKSYLFWISVKSNGKVATSKLFKVRYEPRTVDLILEHFIPGIEARPGYHGVKGVALSPDESLIYAAHWEAGAVSSNDPIAAFSTSNYSLVNRINGGQCVGDAVTSIDGRYVYAPEYYGGCVSRYDTWNGNAKTSISLGSCANKVWKAPSGDRIIVSYNASSGDPWVQSRLALINISGSNFSLLSSLNAGRPVSDTIAAFSDDGQHMYLAAGSSTTVGPALMDIALTGTFRIIRSLELTHVPNQTWVIAGVAKSGGTLFVGDWTGSALYVVDEATFAKRSVRSLSDRPLNIAMHPDQQYLFIVHDIGILSARDISTLEEVTRLTGLHSSPCDIEFKRDGTKAFIAHSDQAQGGVSIIDIH